MTEDRFLHLGNLLCQDREEAAGVWTLATRRVHRPPAEREEPKPTAATFSRFPAQDMRLVLKLGFWWKEETWVGGVVQGRPWKPRSQGAHSVAELSRAVGAHT